METAQELGKHGFNSLAPLTSASVPSTDYTQADLQPGTESVQDVLSSTGHPLVRGKSSASFTTPKKGS